MKGTIRDQIKDFRRVPARELLDNDGNPRRHPQAQRDALRGVLEQVGIAAAVVAYHSERTIDRPPNVYAPSTYQFGLELVLIRMEAMAC
jgi:hypothetical protein